MIADYAKHQCSLNEPVMCQDCVDKLKQENETLREVGDILENLVFWKNASDDQMRLRLGEATAQELRTVRAVLNQICGK